MSENTKLTEIQLVRQKFQELQVLCKSGPLDFSHLGHLQFSLVLIHLSHASPLQSSASVSRSKCSCLTILITSYIIAKYWLPKCSAQTLMIYSLRC